MEPENNNDTNDADIRALHGLTDADFIPLPDTSENCLYLDPENFPEISDEPEGSPVMLVVKGQIGKSMNGEITFEAYDAALVHGAYPNRKAPLGEGGRFAALKEKLARRGAYNPGALASYIGRKKYGKSRFQKLSYAGRKRD